MYKMEEWLHFVETYSAYAFAEPDVWEDKNGVPVLVKEGNLPPAIYYMWEVLVKLVIHYCRPPSCHIRLHDTQVPCIPPAKGSKGTKGTSDVPCIPPAKGSKGTKAQPKGTKGAKAQASTSKEGVNAQEDVLGATPSCTLTGLQVNDEALVKGYEELLQAREKEPDWPWVKVLDEPPRGTRASAAWAKSLAKQFGAMLEAAKFPHAMFTSNLHMVACR
jgi:hypothetical protein